MVTPANLIAALLTLMPLVAAAFFGTRLSGRVHCLPAWVQLAAPAALCLPYLLVAVPGGSFRWGWLALYALLPIVVAGLLWQAKRADAEQRGNWRDFLVLATLGLAVDLRWFEGAWQSLAKCSCLTQASTAFLSSGNWAAWGLTCVCASPMLESVSVN